MQTNKLLRSDHHDERASLPFVQANLAVDLEGLEEEAAVAGAAAAVAPAVAVALAILHSYLLPC